MKNGRIERMPVDIFGNEEGVRLVADLPGVKPEDLTVEVHKGTLLVVGRRSLAWPEVEEEAVTVEYRRRFQVPEDIDVTQVTADLKQGVLTVTMPKLARRTPRKIPITVV